VSLRDELRSALERFFREVERVIGKLLDDLEKPSGSVSLKFSPPTKKGS